MPYEHLTHDDLDYHESGSGNSKKEEWRLNGQLHSVDDEPAVVINGGEELQWYKYGRRHREEAFGPAWVRGTQGQFLYYKMGMLHRKNGPATITPFELKWYSYGKVSRNDGPAVITKNPKVNSKGETISELSPRDPRVRCEWFWQGVALKNMDEWAMVSECDPEIFVLLKLEFG